MGVVLRVMGVVECVGCSGVCRGPIVQRLVVFCFHFISFCFFLSPVFFLAAETVEANGDPRFHRAVGTLLTIQSAGPTL